MINNSDSLDIREGTISFWIEANRVDYGDGKTIPITTINPKDGSIFIVKDSDNRLKLFHVFLGNGRTDVDYDVSNLDKGKKHMFAFTWSVKAKLISMYIDGKSVSTSIIDYK